MFETYTPSGRFSLMFLPWLLVGSLAIVVLAFVYQLGLHFIPFIYINFFLTLFVGVAVGFATSTVIKLGKIRNTPIAFFIMLLLAFTAIGAKFGFQYLQSRREFAAEIENISPQQLLDQDNKPLAAEQLQDLRRMMLQSYTFKDHIEHRVASGWQIGKPGQANQGNPVSGIMVYLVWAVEAITVLYIAGAATSTAVKQPFSEQTGQWASENEVVLTLPITSEDMVMKIKAANSVDDLLKLPVPNARNSDKVAIYTVHSIPGEELEDAYLTVDLQTTTSNKKGETQVNTKTLVRNAVLKSSQRAQLKDNATALNAAF